MPETMSSKKTPRKGTSAHVHNNTPAAELLEDLVGPLSFGGLLKAIRKGEDWTQQQMADKLGVTKGFVSNIEKGKPVSPAAAKRYAEVLGYSPRQFVELALQDELRSDGIEYAVRLEEAIG